MRKLIRAGLTHEQCIDFKNEQPNVDVDTVVDSNSGLIDLLEPIYDLGKQQVDNFKTLLVKLSNGASSDVIHLPEGWHVSLNNPNDSLKCPTCFYKTWEVKLFLVQSEKTYQPNDKCYKRGE